jgi:ABC-type transport system involved in multi-copper enzyme maturation permease subunit
MIGHLVRKELQHHLLDFRFLAILALSVVLSILSVYVGTTNYTERLSEYGAVSEANRKVLQESLEKPGWRALRELRTRGYSWDRRPEALSAVVFGLSGTLGRQVHIKHLKLLHLWDSPFSVDSAYALFGTLDFAFVVSVILSLCALLITYDAICGEKEAGTLRTSMSFPVSRSRLALAKLFGSALAVFVPYVLGFLVTVAVLSLKPSLAPGPADWARLASLMVVFGLYLLVFTAFGIFVSALTQRRVNAFLVLLGLWIVWIFVVPNLATRIAHGAVPVDSVYELDRNGNDLRWEVMQARNAEQDRLDETLPNTPMEELTEAHQLEIRARRQEIDARWDETFYARLKAIQKARRSGLQQRQRLAATLSAVSPLGAATFLAMDLARTGPVQTVRLEEALDGHLAYLAEFVRANRHLPEEDMFLRDYAAFTYADTETLGACLARNVWSIVNLGLLVVLGFAGAYAAMLRYDVR